MMNPTVRLLGFVLLASACARRPQRSDQASEGSVTSRLVAQILPAGGTPPAAAPETSDAGEAPTHASGLEASVPALDAATVAHVRQVFEAGEHAGNHPDVFAKIGDSITESGSFLGDIGHGWIELASYGRLQSVVHFFSRHAFSSDHEDNSFSRGSQSATAGWTTEDLLDGAEHCPIEQELASIHPAFAFVMIGTNDAARGGLPHFEHNLMTVLDRIEAHHTVSILSTIPDEPTGAETAHAVAAINTIIAHAAASRHLPFVDLHAAFSGLPNHGLSSDHIHPSVFVQGSDTKAAVFTARALAFGYNVRNLTSLIALEHLMQTLSLH